jgi:hypothetical protein
LGTTSFNPQKNIAINKSRLMAMLLLVYSSSIRGLTSAGEMSHVFFETMGGPPFDVDVGTCAPVSDYASGRCIYAQFSFADQQNKRGY